MSGPVGDGSSNQDVDLNLAPIIDCFTVLITYLLVTASFLTLSSIDVSVAATGTATPSTTPDNKPPPWAMTVELKAGGMMEIQIRGGPQSKKFNYAVASSGGTWDIEMLTRRLLEIQKKFPTLTEVNVTAEPVVIYKDMVTVLKEIQTVMPKVYISG